MFDSFYSFYKIRIYFFLGRSLTYNHPNIRTLCDMARPVNDLSAKNLIALISFSELPFFFEFLGTQHLVNIVITCENVLTLF